MTSEGRKTKKKFKMVVVGGTFDEFHKGHRALLMKAFEIGNHVIIGLSTDKFVNKLRKPHKVSTYNDRLRNLEAFLKEQEVSSGAEVLPLNDPYGVTVSNNLLDAIVVSKETEQQAHEINVKREASRLPPLKIIVVNKVLAENGIPISTTRIRQKEINHKGKLLKH